MKRTSGGTSLTDTLSKTEQAVWGAAGGLVPFAIRLIQVGIGLRTESLPPIGTFYLAVIAASMALGAIAAYAFRAHDVLPALYHGGTAPITLAFLTGMNTHLK